MKIEKDVSLLNYNTFHIDAKAKFFVKIKSESDIQELLQNKVFIDNKRFFLGGGSNILLTGNFDGLVIKNEIFGKEIIKEEMDCVYVKSGAGEQWNAFVFWCVKNNFGGVENLISIPGTVGASPVQNIGAYGVEVKDVIYEVEGINIENGNIEIFKNENCLFSYRDSIFKHKLKDKFIITSVTYKLKKIDIDYKFNLNYRDILQKISELNLSEKDLNIKDFVDIIISLRVGKLPNYHEVGTAGSFFKNPMIKKGDYYILKEKFPEINGFEMENGVKLSAGWLIEKIGFKGMKRGNIGVYDGHALILVNYGGGTGKEILELASEIQKKVFEIFNVKLEPEVIYL